MIDLRRLRNELSYRAGAIKKGTDSDVINRLLEADIASRSVTHEADEARAAHNAASKEIGRATADERPEKISHAGTLKISLEKLENAETIAKQLVEELILQVPNPAHESVPEGGEEEFIVIKEVGERTEPREYDHADLGELLGMVDSERAVKNSGSRFAYLMGPAVRLEFALIQYVFDLLEMNDFIPVVPPVLVREEMMIDAGFFPTDRNQVYEIAGDDLFLTGTAEVALAGLHRGERLDRAKLPIRYAGFSSCFRREAGTYGKDTRGIFRVHQFDKVEMFSFCDPDSSWEELEKLRDLQEKIVSSLNLPYRVIAVAAGDLGAAAAKKYDLEVWLPSEGAYREVTSCSNYTDYSARRMSSRYKDDSGSGLVHTLNGTACAISRTLVFLMENCQMEDGSIEVPEVLQKYVGYERIDGPK
ncbi:MAG: serine--tRNA ligase [Acidimicrobiales bacterium]|nr:serine--tRNA ligase [Acidimicrobiales bacterium]